MGYLETERMHLIYFELDRSLLVTESVSILNGLLSKRHFNESFEIIRPTELADVDFGTLQTLRERIVVLKPRSAEWTPLIRGEFMHGRTSEHLVFCGFTWHPSEEQWADLQMTPVQFAAQAPAGHAFVNRSDEMKNFFQDISQIDASLLREKKRFEALFQYSNMAILVSDDQGRIVLANQMALSTFGFDNLELIGQKVELLIPARYQKHHVGHRERYNLKPQNRNMGAGLDLYAIRKDATEFPVEISLGHYQTEEGKFVIAYIIDITKRKEIEGAILRQQQEMARVNNEIEKLNEELEAKVDQRTRQLQETLEILESSRDELQKALSKEKELSDLKTRFVSMASHEFRTPLSTILSSASLVAKYTQTEEQFKRDKHIQRIRSAVSNLTDILNEFLSIGRLEEGKINANFSDFNFKEQVQLVCNEMQSILKPGQHIRLRHAGPEIARLDLSLLRNVIINLVSNAVKFSPENGMIDVETEVNEKQILISIRDYGLGISDEDKKHLFERFFRGKNATNIQGTGLGLHIVSKYVELMNGQISVESELEEGTTFKINFNI